jgi:hypothetical protein
MIIESRFNGPPDSGNGGYSAGMCAQLAPPGTVEVTLRRPPPLDVQLNWREEGDVVRVYDPDGGLVAEARSTTLDPDEVVVPVSWDEAVAASASYPGFTTHPFPTCFVCGPERVQGDGLRLFPGRLPDRRTATPFTVPDQVAPELIWAALDCPGGWAVPLEGRPYVLGRLTARVDSLPAPGERCVVMGAMTGEDGRKAYTLSSLYGADGGLLAAARATWIAI